MTAHLKTPLSSSWSLQTTPHWSEVGGFGFRSSRGPLTARGPVRPHQLHRPKDGPGSPDCWANHWYNPPYSPRTVLIQSEQKGWQNHSGPLTSSTLPLWTAAVWSTLQSSEHQNDQTQEQFLPPSNPSHEHLTLTWNTTLFYNYLFTTHTYIIFFIYFFHLKFAHVRPVHTWLSVLHSVFAILYIAYLYSCILFFCCLCPVLLLSFCCTVELCHYNKFLVCVNIPGQ